MGEKEEGSGDRPDGEHEILEIDEEKCIVSRKYSKRKENQEDTQPRLKRRKRWQTEVAAKRSRNKLGLSVENCSKRRKKMEEEPYANKIGSFPNHINEKTVNVEATKNGPKFCKIKSDKFSAKAKNNCNFKDILTMFKEIETRNSEKAPQIPKNVFKLRLGASIKFTAASKNENIQSQFDEKVNQEGGTDMKSSKCNVKANPSLGLADQKCHHQQLSLATNDKVNPGTQPNSYHTTPPKRAGPKPSQACKSKVKLPKNYKFNPISAHFKRISCDETTRPPD